MNVTVNLFEVFYRTTEDAFEPFVITADQKELSVFYDMSKVVVRAIAPVTDVDILRSGYNGMSVDNGAKGTKFVLLMNRLQESGCIQMRAQILKCVDMNAIRTLD